jgi:pyrimidine-nucleoside phosphorylase
MSKKLSEDLDGLVLDVKVGSGAFMRTVEDARELASVIVGIGDHRGTPVTALLTDMSQPLGCTVGNANEIVESIDVLKGGGPSDVTNLTIRLASEMLLLAGESDPAAASEQASKAITSGAALDVFARLTERQGGDPRVIDDPSLLEIAPSEYVVEADRAGYVARCDALSIGNAAVRLGAGRATKESIIDPGVGFTIDAKVGDEVALGEPLARIAYRDESSLDNALAALDETWEISDDEPERPEQILGVIT